MRGPSQSEWQQFLSDPAGVALSHREGSARQAEAAARELKFFCARVSGKDAQDKASLMDRLAVQLRFPDYFGKNWDALNDCLTDLPDWLPAPGYLIVFSDAQDLLGIRRTDRIALEAVLESAAKFWREQKPPRSLKAVFFVSDLDTPGTSTDGGTSS